MGTIIELLCSSMWALVFNDNNSMHMIWHDNELIQRDMFKMLGNFLPKLFYHRPDGIEFQCSPLYITEQTLMIFCAYGDEIPAIVGVIPFVEADVFSFLFHVF
ncbi:hypothetical protein K9L63_00815 [Candidatus Gracilibacteria bacterium]|nr:hypothetical protein [Candidatus Gracilibacteria bacterium]